MRRGGGGNRSGPRRFGRAASSRSPGPSRGGGLRGHLNGARAAWVQGSAGDERDQVEKSIKSTTSPSQRFPWVKKVYWRNEFWSEGFFSSTVGIDEAVIQRYVEFQEKADTGQLKLQLDFGFGSPVPRA